MPNIPQNQPVIDPNTTQVSMDASGLVIHIMIAGVLVGFAILSWTQLKVDTPEQRQVAFRATKTAVKTAGNSTIDIFGTALMAFIDAKLKERKDKPK